MIASLYAGAMRGAAPALRLWLRRRAARGKEEPARLAEREGIASVARPPGPLVWLHGASMGELRSARPLLDLVARERPALSFLLTSGTLTSAAMVAADPPPRTRHQFVPLDVPAWVDRFLAHWRPGAALWLESELWPNLLGRARAQGVRLALVNGRMSPRSFARWQRLGTTLAPLAAFDPCLAMSEADAARLRALGADARYVGNLKFDGAPLACDPAALAALRAALGGRPAWLAASTHPGEERALARLQRDLRAGVPDALLILVPRHAARGTAIAEELRAEGVPFARRAAGEAPRPEHAVYLADTMGELGLFYRLAAFAFVGKSLDESEAKGGQNPIEPARLAVAPVFGPHMANFRDVAATLVAAGGAVQVAGAAELARLAPDLLRDRARCDAIGAAARAVAEQGSGAAARVAAALRPLLDVAERDARA